MQTITFNNGTEDVTLAVQSCFAYTYNAIKMVLKLVINEDDHRYSDVEKLKNVTGSIIYKEDGEIKSEYTGYTLGKDAFSCNYAKGVFSVEIERSTSDNIRMDLLEKLIKTTELNVSDLEDAVIELTGVVYDV